MNIPRHFPASPPLQFGERYKSKADMLEGDRQFNRQMGMTSVGTALAGISSIPFSAGPALFSIASGAFFALSTFGMDEQYKEEIEKAKAEEPIQDSPEQSIEKALKALDEERQKQREMKEQILKAYAAEEAKLTTLIQEASLTPPPNRDKPLSMTEELALHSKGLEIQNQEKTVAQMKVHAEAATAIVNQFEAKMQEVKKRYLGMMDQLQQIKQNKKMLEMQKDLEQLKASSSQFPLQSPELKGIQEKLDEELHKSNGLVENFLMEASALSQLQAQDQADYIKKLKKNTSQ